MPERVEKKLRSKYCRRHYDLAIQLRSGSVSVRLDRTDLGGGDRYVSRVIGDRIGFYRTRRPPGEDARGGIRFCALT